MSLGQYGLRRYPFQTGFCSRYAPQRMRNMIACYHPETWRYGLRPVIVGI